MKWLLLIAFPPLLPLLKNFLFYKKEWVTASSNGLERFEIGPSRVRALPLAAGINVGGHYKWHFFLFSLSFSPGSLLILPEGVVVGF
jgi:hypothetical protein